MNEEEFVPGKWITHKWGVDYGNHQDFFLISNVYGSELEISHWFRLHANGILEEMRNDIDETLDIDIIHDERIEHPLRLVNDEEYKFLKRRMAYKKFGL